MPVLKGAFKSFQYSWEKNGFKKTGFDRNILSQPGERNRKWSAKSVIVDGLKSKLVEYK